jgi:hypothetical protein
MSVLNIDAGTKKGDETYSHSLELDMATFLLRRMNHAHSCNSSLKFRSLEIKKFEHK